VNESEKRRWVTKQCRMENMRFQVSDCRWNVSFSRTDVRGETIPDSRSCRAKTSSTKLDVTMSDGEKIVGDRP